MAFHQDRMNRFKYIFIIGGIITIGWGYHLLAVPPDASYQVMLERARSGMLFTLAGGISLIIAIAQK